MKSTIRAPHGRFARRAEPNDEQPEEGEHEDRLERVGPREEQRHKNDRPELADAAEGQRTGRAGYAAPRRPGARGAGFRGRSWSAPAG